MVISRPTLVVYAFAPKRLPTSQDLHDEAVQYIRRLWDACTRLGMTASVEGLELPTEFPRARGEVGTAFRLLAAKQDKERRADGADYQSYLYEYQDVFGLVATLETSTVRTTLAHWQTLYGDWMRCLRDESARKENPAAGAVADVEPPEGLLGEAFLFHALCGEETLGPGAEQGLRARLFEDLARGGAQACPPPAPGGHPAEPASDVQFTETGFCVWKGRPQAGRRVFALLSPETRKDELFAWTAWEGTGQLAPFARYLMHSSKVHFSQKVFERERSRISEQRAGVDAALNNLLTLHDRIKSKQYVDLDELETVQHELDKARAGGFDLLYYLSRLKELSLTVQIAEQNLGRLIPAPRPGPDAPEGAPFRQDAAHARWLREQLDFERTYLEAVHQRAQEGHQIITTHLEFESRRSERRLNRLILLQGTLLGSLLTGLTAIQSLVGTPVPPEGVNTTLFGVLRWSLVALLMALALALPPLFAHWQESYRTGDRLAAGVLGAALGWFLSALLSVAAARAQLHAEAPFAGWFIFQSLAAAAGLVLGYLGAVILERMKRRGR